MFQKSEIVELDDRDYIKKYILKCRLQKYRVLL